MCFIIDRFVDCYSHLRAKSFFMRLPFIFIALFVTGFLAAQCFNPPAPYTLYSTSNAAAYGTASTGFGTLLNGQSGVWSVDPATTGVTANFSDNEGRSSTINLTGTGNLVVNADITENFVNIDNCQQSYTVANYAPNTVPNPTLAETCPLNIVIIVDESGSIEQNMSVGIVRDAVMALVNNLDGTGSSLALVEFASTASRMALNGSMELQTVDAALVSAVDSYFDNDYMPVSDPLQLIGGTNWEDAFLKAAEVNDADLVFMLTDGRPTFYNFGSGMGGSMGIAGEGDLFDLTALKEAQDAANAIKAAGTRVFVAGLDFPSNVQSMIDISGSTQVGSPASVVDLVTGDYALFAPTTLVGSFADITGVCEEPEPIPTMGEWSLMSLSLILLIFAVTAIKQKSMQLS